jgi:hypothetical protein
MHIRNIYIYNIVHGVYVTVYMGPDVTRTRRAGHHRTRAAQYFSTDISSLSAHIYFMYTHTVCAQNATLGRQRDYGKTRVKRAPK